MASLPFSRLHSSDPETDRIVQDLYDKISQTAVLAQQNTPVSSGATPVIQPVPPPAQTPTYNQAQIRGEIVGLQNAINQVQAAIRTAPPAALPGLQQQLTDLINQLNALIAQLG